MFPQHLVDLSYEFQGHRKPIVLGFMGKAGAGKDTAFQLMEKIFGGSRFAFADRMKAGLKAMGLEEPPRELKEENLPGEDFSYRDAGQDLGTKWGRGLDPMFWVNRLDNDRKALGRNLADEAYYNNRGLIAWITDVRFQEEVDYIHANDGYVIGLNGRKYGMTATAGAHASETQPIIPDFNVWNVGTELDLEFQLMQVLVLVAHLYKMQKGVYGLDACRLMQAYALHHNNAGAA